MPLCEIGDRLHSSRLLCTQVLTPLLEHNLKRLLVEKYGLVDSDLQHEIDRSLNYHENLDNILSIHSLADEVTRYEVERELELIEKHLERKFDVDNTETRLQHVECKPLLTNLVGNDDENGFEKMFNKYFDLFYDEKLISTANPIGTTRKIELKPKLQQKMTGELSDIWQSKHKHMETKGSGTIESFDKLCAHFFKAGKNKRKILKKRNKAKELLKKWERILSANV
jgi:hypothetical protein